jgi:hypothetical protein
VEDLAVTLVIAHGLVAVWLGLRLRALHARSGDPLAKALAQVCLVGGARAAVLLAAIHLVGGGMVAMNALNGYGRLVIGGCYLTLGAGIVTTIFFVRTAYYPGSRAIVAASVLVGGFFVLEAFIVPWVGFTVPAVGLSLAHFPVEIAVYGWAAFEGFTSARRERARPYADLALSRRHHLLGWAFVMPALWVVSSFVLIRHPQLMGLGASLGLASQALVWRAFPVPAKAEVAAAVPLGTH